MNTVFELQDICKSYGPQKVLDHFDLQVHEGEFLAIQGESGAGKSTILNLLGLMDKPDSGKIVCFGKENIRPFSEKARKVLESHISYLFQNFALLEDKTVEYNLGMVLKHPKSQDSRQKIAEALTEVGLPGYEKKKICECSGGEQQRVALARILLKKGDVILADEPTGSLDQKNKEDIIGLLKKMNEQGRTVVVVSHDPQVIEAADRAILLKKYRPAA